MVLHKPAGMKLFCLLRWRDEQNTPTGPAILATPNLKNVDGVAEALGDGSAVVGTVDAWVIYLLTGRVVTDVTNASRTMLMDLEDLDWSPEACDFFEIPMNALPAIVSSSGDYGKVRLAKAAVVVLFPVGCCLFRICFVASLMLSSQLWRGLSRHPHF